MPHFSLSDFDFDLPPELVAQHPAPERSGSRLLDGTGPLPVDRVFRDLPALLSFLSAIKAGKRNVQAPVYSHLTYDVLTDRKLVIDRPDILIFEGKTASG